MSRGAPAKAPPYTRLDDQHAARLTVRARARRPNVGGAMAFAGDPRTGTTEWLHTCKRILQRDDHRCTWIENGRACGAPAREVDHIVPHHRGGSDDDSNLRSLCTPHHARKTAAEGVAERNRLRALRKRPTRTHPAYRQEGGGASPSPA